MQNKKDTYKEFHKKTKQQYKLIKENNYTYRNMLPILNKYVKREDRVLDIGCGAGTLCFYLAKKGVILDGIDIAEEAIKICRESARSLNLKINFYVNNFPEEAIKGKFDAIIISEVIEHVEDEKKAMLLLYKLLKRRGYIVLSTPSSSAPLYKLGVLDKFDKEVGHLRRYSLDHLVFLSKKAGFILVESICVEGILRNFLFTNKFAGVFVKVINKFNLSDLATRIDNKTLKIFGPSNYILILTKR